MLHGVGVDVVDVARVERLLAGGSFARRWFSEAEAARCRGAADYAALLAAKEAAWKALRIAWEGNVPWRHIEVTGHTATLTGAVADAAAAAGVGEVLLTLTTAPDVATAAALAVSRPSPAGAAAPR